MFRILFEVIRGGGFGPDSDVAFMLDQCHNVEDKIPGQIRSVLNVQEMTARALLVDRDALLAAQEAGDVLGANGILMDAFYTDVRPDLAGVAGVPRSAGRPDARLRRVGLPGQDQPNESAASRPDGERDAAARAELPDLRQSAYDARRHGRNAVTRSGGAT